MNEKVENNGSLSNVYSLDVNENDSIVILTDECYQEDGKSKVIQTGDLRQGKWLIYMPDEATINICHEDVYKCIEKMRSLIDEEDKLNIIVDRKRISEIEEEKNNVISEMEILAPLVGYNHSVQSKNIMALLLRDNYDCISKETYDMLSNIANNMFRSRECNALNYLIDNPEKDCFICELEEENVSITGFASEIFGDYTYIMVNSGENLIEQDINGVEELELDLR